MTIKLLVLRVKRLAAQSRFAEMADTARTLCTLEDGDGDDQFTLARALAICVRYLDNDRLQGLSGRDRTELKRRCTDRAVAAVSRDPGQGISRICSN